MRPLSRPPYVCKACQHTLDVSVKRRAALHGFQRHQSTATPRDRPFHLAIIGSGPAGYYTAYRLMKKLPNIWVTMFESLPVPYGLVRFGVAPDHPEVKKSAETLEDVGKWPQFDFAGNVQIGNGPQELPLSSIAPHYDAMLFAYGASKDRRLNIPGEDLKGVVSARAFVGWYNGLPEYADLNPDLQSGDTAVVIGQGNVALDIARFLLSPVDMLKETDASEQALEALSRSKIRDVKIIGRRGPLQAPYTIKELRELMNLPGVGFAPPPGTWDELIQVERKKLPRQLKRIAEVLERGSKTPMESAVKAWQLGYMRSPVEFLSSTGDKLEAVGFEQTEYTASISSLISGDPQKDLNSVRNLKAKPTGRRTMARADLAFRSVGYQSEPLPGFDDIGVPFDENFGIIPNDMYGRVIAPDRGPAGPLTAGHVPGMYCSGWVKRGPTGVIASTMDDAFNTADIIARDWEDGARFNEGEGERKEGFAAVDREMKKRGVRSVSWAEWQKIDAEERRRGKEKGKMREKIRSVEEMMKILNA
ncbi:NADPH-adrenodoxin reductase [Saxophila tyrrhenica]|uniref:NADPH:adrenodoxin oxidoreductase, mitochondrial n=1 Tax=Saxophila tyrrhenica TaxID=1690608 RepID=A0AAV9PQM9_9PEZI|nr:NADPH-adrenodoxin reductase [Saxophila tyrrhenica]